MTEIWLLGDSGEPDITPHPALVAATVPTARDVMYAAAVLGWIPSLPVFPVAAIGRFEED